MIIEQTVEAKSQGVRAQPTVSIADKKRMAPPQLTSGDRLTRSEFEQRYDAMPHIKKAELIQGVVYMPPPVRTDIHGRPHAHIMGWLAVYCAATPGVDMSDNATVRLKGDNEPQPDALLRLDETLGGNSRIDDDGYIEGGPELIVEVAGTSADYDLHEKLDVYQRHGVKEYVVWQTEDKQLNWFRLVGREYVLLAPGAENTIESQVFPGLRLMVQALLEGDLAKVLSELQRGLETDEHAEFVESLLVKSNQR